MTQEQIDRIEAEREVRYAFARYMNAKTELDASLWMSTSMDEITPALARYIAARNVYKLLWCDTTTRYGFGAASDCRHGLVDMVESCTPLLKAAFDDARPLEGAR